MHRGLAGQDEAAKRRHDEVTSAQGRGRNGAGAQRPLNCRTPRVNGLRKQGGKGREVSEGEKMRRQLGPHTRLRVVV